MESQEVAISGITAQRRLALLWYGCSGVLFIALFVLTVASDDRDYMKSVWAWFLPTVAPTLSLMTGVVIGHAQGKTSPTPEVSSAFVYRLAFILSTTYLTLVFLTFLLGPLSGSGANAILEDSQLWLAPLQGLTAAALAHYFILNTK